MKARFIAAALLMAGVTVAAVGIFLSTRPQAKMKAAKPRVLILCTGNSCRSIMAEAIWRHLAGDKYEVQSAGTHPKGVHPLTLRVLAERGVSVAGLRSKSVAELDTADVDLLITVCDSARDNCPYLPGNFQRLHWPFDDPPAFQGTEEEQLAVFRRVRDEIWHKIAEFLQSQLSGAKQQ